MEVVFVATLLERRETEVTRMQPRSYITEWVIGIVGVLAGGVGAWMYYVPNNWFLGGLAEGWPFGMFIAAGVLLAAAFGLMARKIYLDDGGFTPAATFATVLALAALGAAT